MQRDLEDKVVWINGASGGMGQKIATTFSEMKMKVILSDINEDGLLKTASKCSNFVSIKPFDITSFNEVQKIVEEIKNEFGCLDILVNAAGINIQNRDWDNIDENEWDLIFKVNVSGMFYCCKSALPIMKKQKDGLIMKQ